MIKRIFDLLVSSIFILLLSPLFIAIAIYIMMDSKGGILFKQVRVGLNNKDFKILKFRTMYVDSEKSGQLTIGGRDPRVTKAGYTLRKYKLDELPQFFNVLFGDMSIVGPRPEVRRYVNLYNTEQQKVLTVKPGITDYASIEYSNENELLSKAVDPEKTYIEEIMPAKLALNLKYINEQSIAVDFKIMWQTAAKIIA
jgi:lipopolysaccharide/colanic/teichoic acid biosynthesis glycosyltransferase